MAIVNTILPLALLISHGSEPGTSLDETGLQILVMLGGMHLVASGCFLGCAAVRRRSPAWVWTMAGGFVAAVAVVFSLYNYALDGAGMSAIVYFIGPFLEAAVAAVVGGVAGAVVMFRQWRGTDQAVYQPPQDG